MISQKRDVVALIRKRQLFKCGCQRWCPPVPSDDPASLVPEGHGGWQVCVGGISTFLANFVRRLVLGNQCCRLCSAHQFKVTQPRYTDCVAGWRELGHEDGARAHRDGLRYM